MVGYLWEKKGKKIKIKEMGIDGARRRAMVVAPKDDKPVEE
jgi:hypothetical protein